jgi:hypothetical protein
MRLTILLAILFAATASLCHGAILYVTLDTSLLVGNAAAPFYLEFQLNDGRGTNDGNNTALVQNFDFGGGAPLGFLSATGGAAGDLFSDFVSITDNSFFNQFFQEFNPGAFLKFDVTLTTLVDPGPQPDQFSVAILDCSQTEIPTTSPANALLSADITSPLTIRTFAGNPNGALGCNAGPGIPIPSATVTVSSEPPSFHLIAIPGVLLLCTFMCQRRPCRS